MLLTLTTTHRPATDLGYLLHKNPARVHEIDLAFATARVFYPHASEDRCTAALLLDVDPVGLTRRRPDAALEQYVNDRPYAVSSFLAVALGRAFGTALSGRSKERQELADRTIPLVAEMPTLPLRGGPALAERLFAPLGYRVATQGHALDTSFPQWGESPYYRVTLSAEVRLRDLLRHLTVLVPVLDDRKHYWVDEAEIEKLLRRGEGWLGDHPERELIVQRYLRRQRHLTRAALERLTADEADDPDEVEVSVEAPLRLHDLRLDRVAAVLEALGATTVADLGCGDGRLLERLLRRPFRRVVGLDASIRALEAAHRRLHLDEASPLLRDRVELLHGALTYRDARIEGFDAAALVEVVEHLDADRLQALERSVWGYARPRFVVLTTPNREYNARFPGLADGGLRHPDHRFEWSRDDLRSWAAAVAERFTYRVSFEDVGEADPQLGPPTQMAVFERCD